jgi:hypothetical protein
MNRMNSFHKWDLLDIGTQILKTLEIIQISSLPVPLTYGRIGTILPRIRIRDRVLPP